MKPTILVVTTVHHPDDTRIRERLIRTLTSEFAVRYAARSPGPSDTTGLAYLALKGGRLRRNLSALRLLLRRDWDVAVVHDPELVPTGALAKLFSRRPVVFDVHEDVVAQVMNKAWIPVPLRPVARLFGRCVYWLAERTMVLTLAEEGYHGLFHDRHAVFPNYPLVQDWPEREEVRTSAIYVGDISLERGLGDAVIACGRAKRPLVVVGQGPDSVMAELRHLARRELCDLTLVGRLPNPEALRLVAKSAVGLSPLRALPNYLHSLPTKTLEYLSVGIPVVTTDLPGTRLALGELDAVTFVIPGDIEALAEAVRESVGQEMVRAAAAQAPVVRARYRWPSKNVLAFYEALLTCRQSKK